MTYGRDNDQDEPLVSFDLRVITAPCGAPQTSNGSVAHIIGQMIVKHANGYRLAKERASFIEIKPDRPSDGSPASALQLLEVA
jgi:hypothetical protein